MKSFLIAFLLAVPFVGHAASLQLPASMNGLPKSGELRYRYLFFKVFDAALYAPQDAGAETLLEPQTPRVLLIRYHRDVPASQFIKLAQDTLEKQLPDNRLGAIDRQLAELNRSYRDVGEGDTYLLCYDPEAGMEVFLNDRKLAAFDCGEFARDYFSIWFGDHPLSGKMKERLLGTE